MATRPSELLVRNRYVLLADVALFGASAFLAFALRFDLDFIPARPEFFFFLLAVVVVKPSVFFSLGMYRRFWRYASLDDMLVLGLAVSAASVLLAVVSGVARSLEIVPMFSRAVLLIDWLLTLVAVASVRAAVRMLGESRARARVNSLASVTGEKTRQKRVLVVGAGEAGALVVREMQRNPQIEMVPVGFLDDDQRKHGRRIYGIPVMGPMSAVERVVKAGRIDEVIIAMPRVSGAVVRAVAEKCRELGLQCRTMPGVFELLDGHVNISRLRHIEIADLLRRSQIHLSAGAGAYLEGRTVLVTGAGGSIGSELCRQVAHARPRALIMLGHGENSIFEAHIELARTFPGLKVVPVIADIRDSRRLLTIMTGLRPDVVFHAAAHKHVPLMELNPQEAISNNVIGTKNLVDASIATRVQRLVMISTDKAVAPSNIMGASKRMAEMVVREAARRSGRAFVVVRFGNVLGSRGSVVPIFKQQIEQGGPITVTHPEMRRYFMTIPESVHLVIQAGGRGRGGELFVLKMGESVRVVDLARDLMSLSGCRADEIQVVFTGVRPGEKLDEELWESTAVLEATDHPDLLSITEPDEPSSTVLASGLAALGVALAADDRVEMEAALARCIATFALPRDLVSIESRVRGSQGGR